MNFFISKSEQYTLFTACRLCHFACWSTSAHLFIIFPLQPKRKAINLMLELCFFLFVSFSLCSCCCLCLCHPLHTHIINNNQKYCWTSVWSTPYHDDDAHHSVKRSNNSRSSYFEQPRFGISSMKAAAAAAVAAASTKDSPSPPDNNASKQRPAQSAVASQVNYKASAY